MSVDTSAAHGPSAAAPAAVWAAALRQARQSTRAPSVSAVVHARDGRRPPVGTILSLSWADEVLVVDHVGNAELVEIASVLGAGVCRPSGRDGDVVHYFGLTQTRGAWVLVLEGGEYVGEALAGQLVAISAGGLVDALDISRADLVATGAALDDYALRFLRPASLKAAAGGQPQVRRARLDARRVVTVGDAGALHRAATSTAEAGRLADARELLRLAVLDGLDTGLLHALALAESSAGRHAEAVFIARAGVTLEPTSQPAREVLARVEAHLRQLASAA